MVFLKSVPKGALFFACPYLLRQIKKNRKYADKLNGEVYYFLRKEAH